MLRGVLIGILIGLLLVIIGVYYYFAGGLAPVATKAPTMPFEHKLANMALHSYLDKKPHSPAPVPADEPNLLAGAKVYKDHCAVCHGLPGEPRSAIAEGMFPAPPQLFRGVGVTDDEVWETYWKSFDGIRMTGMPAFGEHLGETKTWQVSQLLKNADKISPAVKAELLAPPDASHLMTAPPAAAPSASPSATPSAPASPQPDHDHH
ncbi:MAG TPA: c-type cytochrome [Candidatus Eremiobacteraceae bacterium]|nr:c-type cytochrome [Candidatus Eremiobacteraceae bacterium]